MKNMSLGFTTRSNAKRAVLSQKMGRGLTFRIFGRRGIVLKIYLANTCADQLFSNLAADLRLCYCIMQNATAHCI